MKRRQKPDEETGINITPMLDVVFIMLIFFIVTTSFVREDGLDVSRPSTTPQQEIKQDQEPIVVRIDASSFIAIRGRIIGEDAVHANLEKEWVEKPQAPLVVAAHPDAETRTLVAVLDAARAVGIESVNVATSDD
jgi:biopolymer transport protein ExbD